MSEFDTREQIAELRTEILVLLIDIRHYQTFLMACVVYWSMVGMLATRVEDFGDFISGAVILGLLGFAAGHFRYVKRNSSTFRASR